MTKVELLKAIDLAIDNKAYLLLMAGDYFTDCYKLIVPDSLNNFKGEIEAFGVNLNEAEEFACVKVNSVDVLEFGSMTGDLNQYFIWKAKPILPEEVEALISYLQ